MKTTRTLLAIAAAATLAASLSQPAAARRGDDDRRGGDDSRRGSDDICTTAPRSQWLPLEGFAQRARERGYAVVKIEISGSCYEIYGTKGGVLYELYFNPATGELVKTERENDD